MATYMREPLKRVMTDVCRWSQVASHLDRNRATERLDVVFALSSSFALPLVSAFFCFLPAVYPRSTPIC